MAIASQPVQCTTIRADGLVHFGDILQLINGGTSAVLACDIEDRVSHPARHSTHAVTLLTPVVGEPSQPHMTQDTRAGDFSCAAAASVNSGSIAYNTCFISKYFPAQPTIYDREYTGRIALM